MEYSLEQGQVSNWKITLTVTAEDMATHKESALKNFQKEMKEPGFREGHVPLDIVEQKVNPAYLEMGILEEVVHAGTKKVIEENTDKKFIGNIYDLNREEKDGNTLISYYLDVYPEIIEANKNWEKVTIDKIDDTPTADEIEDTLTNLRKQYADYKQIDAINEDCVFKVKFVMNDKDGKEVDTGSVYLGKEEMTEFPVLVELFKGKKNNEEFTTDYNEKDFPPMLHNRNKEGIPTTVVCTVTDVREVVLPAFTAENIKKFFGNDDVTTEEQLRVKITELIAKQKREMLLMQSVDGMLTTTGSSFTITIPKTLIDEEKKTRMKSLEERMGGEDGMKQYFEKIGEEEKTTMMKDIEDAAKLSLEKFFLLKEIVERLGIQEPDWKTPMDVENKVYEKMMK